MKATSLFFATIFLVCQCQELLYPTAPDNSYNYLENNVPVPMDTQPVQSSIQPIIQPNVQSSSIQPPQPPPMQFREVASSYVPVVIAGGESSQPTTLQLPPEPVLKSVGQDDASATSSASFDQDPEVIRINNALEAVKEDILGNNKMINSERKWVAAVRKITTTYETKVKKVEDHIINLRKEMRRQFKKKKKLENLKLQHILEGKIKDAQDELSKLDKTLQVVKSKDNQLLQSRAQLENTLKNIESQLAKLRKPTAHSKVHSAMKDSGSLLETSQDKSIVSPDLAEDLTTELSNEMAAADHELANANI